MPYHLHHPETGATTTAATRSSLRVLEANGWERIDQPLPPPPEPDPPKPLKTPPPRRFNLPSRPAWTFDEDES